ncbi:uncharacterized protein [Littorina saxatilis]|uniref:uncharacterized protein isoform X2 n=1 Tax=Littorina saxatilis TaxID=31220 RepID=UPI0038B541C0
MVDSHGHFHHPYIQLPKTLPLFPLHSALKTGSGSLHPAKAVSFSLPNSTKQQDVSKSDWKLPASDGVAHPIQDMEAAKLAVAIIMNIPQTIVQLVIDAHRLGLDPSMTFTDSEQLARAAQDLADNIQRQGELALKIHQAQQQLHRTAEPGGLKGAGNCGAGGEAMKDGSRDPPSEMLVDSKVKACPSDASSSSPCPSSSSSISSSSPSPFSSLSSSSSINSDPIPTCPPSEMSGSSETPARNTPHSHHDKPTSSDSLSSTQQTHIISTSGAEPGLGKSPVEMPASENGKATASPLSPPQLHSHPAPSPAQHLQSSDATKTHRELLRKRVKSLAVENRKLKHRKVCRACQKVDLAESGITFLPCGHFITCETCSEMFDDCLACGKNIMGTVRTFLPKSL